MMACETGGGVGMISTSIDSLREERIDEMLRTVKLRLMFAVAYLLGIPIKIRDADYGCSHVILEPSLTVPSEPGPR